VSAPDTWLARPGGTPRGVHRVPGDKSISHRALLIGALTAGTTRIEGLLEGEDPLATARAVNAIGARATRHADGAWTVESAGASALRAPDAPIDCGNSGTTARLLCGVLAALPGTSTLVGDASLSRRPMRRVAAPLARMGATLTLSASDTLPVRITGARLQGFEGDAPIASAQVASALLFAGVASGQGVSLRSSGLSRDHTERLLRAGGARVTHSGDQVHLAPGAQLAALTVRVPGDLSSAAFLLAAAALVPGAALTVEGVGLNPTRTGCLELLARFGAEVETEILDAPGGEPVGRVTVTGRGLRGLDIAPHEVPWAIDELPLLLVMAAAAEGVTTLRGAAELRVKESDRLATVAAGLRALGIAVEERPDGLRITGGRLQGGTVDAAGDHRIAMAFAVAATVATGPVRITGTRQVETSFPGFLAAVQAAGLTVAAA
jgi:3-phosphoshikimate 1-carboxyvinyltransferase